MRSHGTSRGHEIVVVAAVASGRRNRCCSCRAAPAGLPAAAFSPARALREDALPRLVLRHDLSKRGALRRGILRVRMIVVKTRAVAEHEIALDLLKRQRPVLIDLEVGGLICVLE